MNNIIIPPKENEDGAVSIDPINQKNLIRFQRRTMKTLMGALNSTLQDAMREIALCPVLIENPGFYRKMNYGSCGGSSASDLKDWQVDVLKRYNEWCSLIDRLSPQSLTVTKSIIQDGYSINAVRTSMHISEKTALKLLQYALNEYAILSGWGNQINPQK